LNQLRTFSVTFQPAVPQAHFRLVAGSLVTRLHFVGSSGRTVSQTFPRPVVVDRSLIAV
jgi:hypothetical protein